MVGRRRSKGGDLGNCHERMNDDHRQQLVDDSDRGVEMKKEKTNHSTLPSIHLNLKSFVYPKVGFPFPSQSKGSPVQGRQSSQRVPKGISGPLVLFDPDLGCRKAICRPDSPMEGIVGGGLC
jgi:hypothetical protein